MVSSLKWRRAARQLYKLALSSAIICTIFFSIAKILGGANFTTEILKAESDPTPKRNLIPHHIEIYNRASIGEYLLNYLIEGKKELQFDGVTKIGNKSMGGLSFSFISGNLKVIQVLTVDLCW